MFVGQKSDSYGGFVALRLLHFADLHLDRSFAGQRLLGAAGQRRREDLRSALKRIVDRAGQEECDLITCGGDLFEHDHVTRETANFVVETLGGAGRPVLIAPGNRDPAVASSPYRYMRWPDNVTIAAHEELRAYPFDEVTIWSAGFTRPDVAEAPLRNATPVGGEHNLLLLHASDITRLPEGKTPYAPITAAQVKETGFRHALLGHYHEAHTDAWITYPGSPEPLGWDEATGHCVAMVTIGDDGSVAVSLEEINQRRFVEETIDITGMTSPEHVRQALQALKEGKGLEGSVIRATLIGERSRALEMDPQALTLECGDGFAHLEFRDESRIAHDLDAVAQEFTSRGEMVRKLVDQRGGKTESHETVDRALQLALDAFDT